MSMSPAMSGSPSWRAGSLSTRTTATAACRRPSSACSRRSCAPSALSRRVRRSGVYSIGRAYRADSGFRVGPVEVVQDPVAVLEGQVDAFGFDVEAALAALALLPDEALVQDDRYAVHLAGHRVLQGRPGCLADPLGPHGQVEALSGDLDSCAH